MKFSTFLAVLILACDFASAARTTRAASTTTTTSTAPAPSFIRISPDNSSFIRESTGEMFTPWGFNYDRDHKLRLLEDYWDKDWSTVEQDFREMKALGANVVRIHLQFGKFMNSPTEPNAENLQRLRRLVLFAEQLGIYIDVTGLGSYRKRDVTLWYDHLDETSRWDAQANFWSAVAKTLADRPGVFCYDLINEPALPIDKADAWLHPIALAGFHYVQQVVLDVAGRRHDDIARDWTRKMVAAIREHDPRRPITIGLLPITPEQREKFVGFAPWVLKDDLDFIAVHLYPQSKKLDEAIGTLKLFDVGKPLVIEEIFPLSANAKELGTFIERSRPIADGWISFYWGKTIQQMKDEPDIIDKTMLSWLEVFRKFKPTTVAATTQKS